MKPDEVSEFYKFLNNEEVKLENEYILKCNYIFGRRRFDTLDLLDLIELKAKMEYYDYIRNRLQVLFTYFLSAY